MATFTNTIQGINTAANTFYTWTNPISAFMRTAGWLQQADTGQIVWPATIFNITDANGNGTTVTFTGTITNGTTPLRVNSQIKVSGTTNFGTVGTPILYTITGGNLTTTFTALSGTTAHDAAIAASTGWGTVYVQPTMTAVTGAAGVATYTYSNTDGILCPGQSIVIPAAGTTGFTNAGFNGTYTITAVTATTFTAVNGTVASETKTVTGTVATLPGAIAASESTTTTLPPGTTTSLYEIWKMGDGNGLPAILRINYGTGTSASNILLSIVLSSGTDGAGTATGGSTGTVNIMGSNSNSITAPSYFSGSTSRITMAFFTTGTSTNQRGFFNVERSHDTSGVDTTAYVTLTNVRMDTTISSGQRTITSTAVNTADTKIPCIVVTSTGTGSFGASTILSPVFPTIGAVGNPLINVLIGKAADWTDQSQFSFTIYNTSHNYIVSNTVGLGNAAGNLTYDASATCVLIYRYE